MAVGELKIQSALLSEDLVLPITGRNYTPGWIDFEVVDRTINRTLVSDFISIKRKFTVAYDRIYGTLFATLLELYEAKEDVTFVETQADTSESSFTCRLQFPDSVLRALNSGSYGYQGFAFTLEEV